MATKSREKSKAIANPQAPIGARNIHAAFKMIFVNFRGYPSLEPQRPRCGKRANYGGVAVAPGILFDQLKMART
jgi:hypothetical protein